jgi:hypothetical protein
MVSEKAVKAFEQLLDEWQINAISYESALRLPEPIEYPQPQLPISQVVYGQQQDWLECRLVFSRCMLANCRTAEELDTLVKHSLYDLREQILHACHRRFS